MKSLKAMLWSTEGGNLLWSTEVYWSLLWSTEGFRMSTVVLYCCWTRVEKCKFRVNKIDHLRRMLLYLHTIHLLQIYVQFEATFMWNAAAGRGQMERVGEWWQAWNCDLNLFPENGFDFSKLVTKSKIDFLFLRWFKIMMLASYHMVAHCFTILLSLLGIKI